MILEIFPKDRQCQRLIKERTLGLYVERHVLIESKGMSPNSVHREVRSWFTKLLRTVQTLWWYSMVQIKQITKTLSIKSSLLCFEAFRVAGTEAWSRRLRVFTFKVVKRPPYTRWAGGWSRPMRSCHFRKWESVGANPPFWGAAKFARNV